MLPKLKQLDTQIPPQYTISPWHRIVRALQDRINAVLDGYLFNQSTATGNYTVTTADSIILADSSSNITVTIPAASQCENKRFTVKMIGTGNVTVTASSGLIDDATSQIINVQYTSICIVSDGSNYWII